MKHNFDEAQAIIDDLQQAIEKKKRIGEEFKKFNPEWGQLSNDSLMENETCSWMHGASELREMNDLERWLFESPPLSDTAKEEASKCIQCWKDWLALTDAYYGDFENFELETPHEGEILRDYILRMAALVETEGKGARLEWRALKSFLAYMRNIASEEIAFIEQIFPKKMDVCFGRIIRKINPEVYPIPQEIACDLLCELGKMATKGRPNSQLSALESLGLCWLCLTTSRLRLPTYLEMVERIKPSAICFKGEYPTLDVPTLFGGRKIRISVRVANFLIAISKIPSKKPRETILQSPRRSLTRALDRAIQNCAINPEFGNITFVTLLSTPHIFGKDHRYIPK